MPTNSRTDTRHADRAHRRRRQALGAEESPDDPDQPRAGVREARDEAGKWLQRTLLGGTHLPGVISAGRFYWHGEMAFWDVHDPNKAIAIDLRDEHYGHLVIEVDDPEREIGRIQQTAAGVPA